MLAIDPVTIDRFLHDARRQTALGRGGPTDLSPVERDLLDRARLLPDRERWIVELVYRHHVPVRRVGEVLGIDAGTVSRIARRAWRRLSDPIARELARPGLPLPPDAVAVAIDHFLRGQAVAEIARGRGVSPAQVRGMLDFARGFLRATAQRRAQA